MCHHLGPEMAAATIYSMTFKVLKGAMDTQSPRKRKRSAIACTRCHDRKVRCSAAFQGIPCANCAQDGTTCTIYQAHSV
jgi:hypothetical protein